MNNKPCRTTYYFKYSFRNMPYLACDKYGNFFNLPHCQNKRSSNFKKLSSENGYVYYQGNKVRLSALRKRVFINRVSLAVYQ